MQRDEMQRERTRTDEQRSAIDAQKQTRKKNNTVIYTWITEQRTDRITTHALCIIL